MILRQSPIATLKLDFRQRSGVGYAPNRKMSDTPRTLIPMAGSLYLVSTPIGNIEDITLRAVRTLQLVTIIAAEDPQRMTPLCERYGIETPLTSYQNENKEQKVPLLLSRLQDGHSVALVCDAGTPVISDPGLFLVRQAVAAGIRVTPVPGPSAVLAALSASGMSGETFVFQGWLSVRAASRRRALKTIGSESRSTILFESPDRLASTLVDLQAFVGRRRVVVVHDLTKPGEKFVRGAAAQILKSLEFESLRGEIALVIEGGRLKGRKNQRRRIRRQKPMTRRASG